MRACPKTAVLTGDIWGRRRGGWLRVNVRYECVSSAAQGTQFVCFFALPKDPLAVILEGIAQIYGVWQWADGAGAAVVTL